jgi:hypothetical protein
VVGWRLRGPMHTVLSVDGVQVAGEEWFLAKAFNLLVKIMCKWQSFLGFRMNHPTVNLLDVIEALAVGKIEEFS